MTEMTTAKAFVFMLSVASINANYWLNAQRDLSHIDTVCGYYDCDRDFRLKRAVRKRGLAQSIGGIYPATLYQRPLFFIGK